MGSGFSTRSVVVPDPVAGCLPASCPRVLASLPLLPLSLTLPLTLITSLPPSCPPALASSSPRLPASLQPSSPRVLARSPSSPPAIPQPLENPLCARPSPDVRHAIALRGEARPRVSASPSGQLANRSTNQLSRPPALQSSPVCLPCQLANWSTGQPVSLSSPLVLQSSPLLPLSLTLTLIASLPPSRPPALATSSPRLLPSSPLVLESSIFALSSSLVSPSPIP